MKYYIKEHETLINLDGWRKIRKATTVIGNVTVFCIEISYNIIGVQGLLSEDMYNYNTEQERDKEFIEISITLSGAR